MELDFQSYQIETTETYMILLSPKKYLKLVREEENLRIFQNRSRSKDVL